MQFIAIATLFLATALATPTLDVSRAMATGIASFCPGNGLQTTPLCCKKSIVDLFEIDCETPTINPANCQMFEEICEASGRAAKCCIRQMGDNAIVCKDPEDSS